MDDRRKGKRVRIPFVVEVIPSLNATNYVSGEIRDFSPDGFSFDAKNIDIGTDNEIRTRFQVHPESDYINVLGRIVWKIQYGVECQVGIEIKEIDTGDNVNLGFPFEMWKDKFKLQT